MRKGIDGLPWEKSPHGLREELFSLSQTLRKIEIGLNTSLTVECNLLFVSKNASVDIPIHQVR